MEDKDLLIQDLLTEKEKMKEDYKLLEEKGRRCPSSIEDMENSLKEKECEKVDLINHYGERIEDLLSEKECEKVDLINHYGERIEDLLSEKEKMKEDHKLLEEKLGDATNNIEYKTRRLKEKDDENAALINQMEDLDHQIQDLLAKEQKMKDDQELLEGRLAEALRNIEDMANVLEEKNHLQIQIENRDRQIQDLLEKEEKLENDYDVSEDKLRKAFNNMEGMERQLEDKEHQISELKSNFASQMENMNLQIQEAHNNTEDLERLLKKEEEEKTEMANLHHKMIESSGHQIRDLLAKENELKEEQQMLKEKLGEALCCVKDMEKLLKEQQDMKIEMEKMWQLEILTKNQELDMWKQKCKESAERLVYLEEKLGEALNEVKKLGLSLKQAEDSIMETGRLLKEKDKEIETFNSWSKTSEKNC
ncbi:golgin subfamily A member 6-like protein 25 [Macrobrachium rosenbergii]|uniref:golgin subfamily A member 6-like protein 25 n=1 Tax=Macrobrachium rosenbergii TaxID=79674 RepID=UPI0034D39764